MHCSISLARLARPCMLCFSRHSPSSVDGGGLWLCLNAPLALAAASEQAPRDCVAWATTNGGLHCVACVAASGSHRHEAGAMALLASSHIHAYWMVVIGCAWRMPALAAAAVSAGIALRAVSSGSGSALAGAGGYIGLWILSLSCHSCHRCMMWCPLALSDALLC